MHGYGVRNCEFVWPFRRQAMIWRCGIELPVICSWCGPRTGPRHLEAFKFNEHDRCGKWGLGCNGKQWGGAMP